MNVNSSSEQDFLKRLTEITEANLTNSQFGVSYLASEFGKSRSYIHRQLKSISNESVSQFIRRIRLEKALVLLEEDKLTVAEIAYDVGFGSPSYFIKCFHEQFGYSPGDFLKNKIERTKILPEEVLLTPVHVKKVRKLKKRWLIWIFAVPLILLLAFAGNYIINENRKVPLDKSLAVLPFDCFSDAQENRYFADGMTDDITNHLSHINDLKVISRTSTERYRDSDKSLLEIAKELGVSYIIEGSVQKFETRVKIIIQLNDCNDEHIWSDSFDREFSDIFSLQSEIAKKVASELKTFLSPLEIKKIDKVYTQSTEAYNLYLEGRFYHRLRTKKSFKKSMEYHNKALELDSNYCLAYAGLADVYLTSTWFGNFTKEEGANISRAYALKALSIDNNLAEAHATLGSIATHFDYDWDTAEKEFKLALQTDSRNPRIYDLYAQYFDVVGKKEEAREYINKALQLTPNDVSILWFSYYLYRKEGNYIKALELSDKISYIDGNERRHLRQNFEIYLMQNNISKAIEEYKNILTLISPEIDTEMVDSIYATDGKDGFVHYVIEFELKQNAWPNTIATYYAMINEKDSALTFLERSYESGIGGIERVVGEKEFDNLRSEPRFKELLRKINLADEQVSSFQNN